MSVRGSDAWVWFAGFGVVPYNDVGAVERALRDDPNIAAVLLEPIQVRFVTHERGGQERRADDGGGGGMGLA